MIKTLLLTGENNHDWRQSAPYCKKLLEDTGRFSVDLSERPAVVLEDADKLATYDLIFLDYNGSDWGPKARANFSGAVRGGTGLVVLHAANNPFPGWDEFEQMVGLLWREGTGHGRFHEFEVNIVHHDHPVTRGIEDFRTWDELYHRLVNVQGVDYQVLATAYSDPETGGTGRYEPMIVTLRHGEGRVYHHVLGHVWPGDPATNKGSTMIAFESEGFQRTLLRGSQWAAKRDVTL